MTSVIDSLVLEFGLDHKQFTRSEREVLDQLRKMEDEATRTGRSIEREQAKANSLFAGFRRELLGVFSLMIGGYGIKEFVGHITNLDAQTGRLARTMNLSASELSAWQGAAKQVGGSAESITETLQGMTQDMNNFMLTGQGTLASVLRPMGISLFDNNKQLKSATELLLELADAVQGMDPARAAAFLNMIPGMNQNSINLILEGRKAIEGMVEAQRQLGTTTGMSAAEAQAYQKQMAQMQTAAENLGRSLLMYVAPSVTQAMEDINRAFRKGLNPRIAKGSPLDVLFGEKKYSRDLAGLKERWGDLVDAFKNYDPAVDDAKDRLADKLQARAAARALSTVRGGPVGGGDNWERYLKGLSYLETTNRDVGNSTSSAQGYFQFIKGTANLATGAGLQDPRYGTYEQQAAATRAYIQRFHPDAAKAIEAGEYDKASTILKGEWPSLPGGSQQQSADRYQRWGQILRGGGSSTTNSTTVSVGQVNVYTQATDAKGIAADIKPELERGLFPSQFNGSLW
jgi:hypothetical protein